MQKQPSPNKPDLMQQGVDAMRRGDFRFAELTFRNLAREGKGGFNAGANIGLSLIYQQRWWSGVTQLYGALRIPPEDQRKTLIVRVQQGLAQLAGMLDKRRLTGDAADARRLAMALDPFPRGLVSLAARWLPELSVVNQTRLLLDFAQWLQAADIQWPFSGEDIERLVRLAMRHPDRERLVPLLVWGLAQHRDLRQESTPGWALAVDSMASLSGSDAVNRHHYAAMAALDLLSRNPSGTFHLAFTDMQSRLLTEDGSLAPEGLDGWSGLFGQLHPQLDTVAYQVLRTNNLFKIYDVANGEHSWKALWPRVFEAGALDSLDDRELMHLQGELGFLLASRSSSLEERQRLQLVLSTRLGEAVARKADAEGLKPLDPALPLSLEATRRPLRIGYLTRTVGRHPVGYLLDILLRHHSSDVEVYLYDTALPGAEKDDLGKAIIEQAACYRNSALGDLRSGYEIARRIQEDGIQLLIDLDALTMPAHLFIHYFRPAPASCVYLGFEPWGVPWVDYFVVDPYVLPEGAESRYVEQLYRLKRHLFIPEGYAGEVGPETRAQVRSRLAIPDDALVYAITAPGRKLSSEFAEDVAEILRRVPDALLLVKGKGNPQWRERFWMDHAGRHGVDPSRIRFLPFAPLHAHRAELRAVDLVLDTFPFSGGMHSFENLWLGNPVVTRYGESYHSRQTYSMLKNLGIEETIAVSREEYVEKAVRLGLERELREDIHSRLRAAAREGGGIWDTLELIGDLEEGYRKMVQAKNATYSALSAASVSRVDKNE